MPWMETSPMEQRERFPCEMLGEFFIDHCPFLLTPNVVRLSGGRTCSPAVRIS